MERKPVESDQLSIRQQARNRTPLPKATVTLRRPKPLPKPPGKPSLIIAHTVKGKGFSFTEDAVEWHHHVPTAAELATGLAETEQAEQRWWEKYGTLATR